MKYSLMSLMIDKELNLRRPNFIQVMIMRSMGYEGDDPKSADEFFRFMNARGIPEKNGTLSFEDYVRFASENGFDGIDMMSFHFEEDPKVAKGILEKYGITLSAVNIITQFGNSSTDEAFQQCYKTVTEIMDRAFEAGCRNILLMPTGYVPAPGLTREQIFQNMVKGLKACVAYGQEKGMTVNTETLESIAVPLCSNGEMLRLFSEVPSLKYAHDSGNPVVAMEDPVATYQLFKDRVVAVHFKELAFTDEPNEMMTPVGKYYARAPFGEGVIDFKAHLELLKKDDYQGFITIEGSMPAENQLEGAQKALAWFKELEKEL